MSVSTPHSSVDAGAVDPAGPRTVARIELRPYRSDGDSNQPPLSPLLHAWAVHSIEQTVRPDDRLCPYGRFHLAVAFGPDADAVAPKVLGQRLARAVSLGLLMRQGGGDSDQARPRSSATSGSTVPLGVDGGDRRSTALFDATTVVTVDRLLGSELGRGNGQDRGDQHGGVDRLKTGNVFPHLRHRTVLGNSRRTDAAQGTRRGDQMAVEASPCGMILVVECDPQSTGTPGIATLATCSVAERLGFTTRAIPLPTGDIPPVAIEGIPIDVVVLLVGNDPTGQPTPWSSSTWCLPALVAEAYGNAGIDVIAVSVGAGAGALANCVVKGASVLFDLNELPATLARRSRNTTATGRGAWEQPGGRIPPHLQALLRLTSSERRVLFYLTTGTSPRDISLELVVSLATVRSHIRSILRKLGVRSQLAAVALANGSGLIHDGTDPEPADSVTWKPAGSEDARSA